MRALPIMLRRVEGDSMAPALLHGRIIWGWRWFGRLYPGDVVVVQHGGMEKVKRIRDIEGSKIFVVGDNPTASTDSRDFGWLDSSQVRAKVLAK